MQSVAIIGAGLTGLTAGFYFQRRGIPVTVYEASGRAGGVIQSLRKEGYLAEFGPNTILETSPKIAELIRAAGLDSRRLNPRPEAEARYVVRYGRPVEMPSSPLGFMASGLFSLKGKLAVLREPFVKPRRDGVEESIAQFTVRRFNREFLDYAVDALVGGIYAGDPEKLSVNHAFPRLKALEDNYGSMIKGQILGARERKRRGEVAKDRAPKFSFDVGLQLLPDTLAAGLGDALKLNAGVTELNRTANGWSLTTSVGVQEHSAVIFCGTAKTLARLKVTGVNVPRFETFSEVRYPPVASVVLGFRREDVAHPCQGFGMLIPRLAGFKILGTIFSSSLFSNRAPAGHLSLTSYVGGERYPELAGLPLEELYEVVLADLRVLLGVRGKPTFRNCVVYPEAIPQYNVGYGRFKDLLTQVEQQAPGLFLAGHYREGISLSDCIVSGMNVVERVEKTLKSGQPVRT